MYQLCGTRTTTLEFELQARCLLGLLENVFKRKGQSVKSEDGENMIEINCDPSVLCDE